MLSGFVYAPGFPSIDMSKYTIWRIGTYYNLFEKNIKRIAYEIGLIGCAMYVALIFFLSF